MVMMQDKTLARRDTYILSDGTPLRALIDLERREVSLRVFSDPEIYQLELERIFARQWLWLAHESEIPNPGDYVLRYLGEDSVIVNRGQGGGINVLLNVCAHRGMEVCRADAGNATTFNCPYHAWNYDLDGQLLGAPFEKQMYGDWDKTSYGLRSLPCEVRHGMIFGCGADEPEPFDQYLGDYAWYLDAMYADTEWETLGVRMHYVFKGNWKMRADQNAGDLYHAAGAHRSIAEIGGPMAAAMGSVEGAMNLLKIAHPEGHVIFTMSAGRPDSNGTPPDPYSYEGAAFSGLLWPFTKITGGVDRTRGSFDNMVPVGPGAMDGSWLSLVKRDTPEEVKAAMRTAGGFAGSIIGADDAACWQSMQRGASGVLGKKVTAKYNAVAEDGKPSSWPGPGEGFSGFSRDDTQWQFWLKWYDMMTRDEA
jgi:nitrite reductase/ring-hydroxylating ferredoxin subunit